MKKSIFKHNEEYYHDPDTGVHFHRDGKPVLRLTAEDKRRGLYADGYCPRAPYHNHCDGWTCVDGGREWRLKKGLKDITNEDRRRARDKTKEDY